MKNIIIAVVILLIAGYIAYSLIGRKTDQERVANYNKCVNAEMNKYYKVIDPVVEMCTKGDYVACKVVNDGINKKKLEVQAVCSVHLK